MKVNLKNHLDHNLETFTEQNFYNKVILAKSKLNNTVISYTFEQHLFKMFNFYKRLNSNLLRKN